MVPDLAADSVKANVDAQRWNECGRFWSPPDPSGSSQPLDGAYFTPSTWSSGACTTPQEPFLLILHRRRIARSVIGGIRETQEMLDFCATHNIESDIEVIPIQQVNEAYERVLKGDVRFRFVIDLRSLK